MHCALTQQNPDLFVSYLETLQKRDDNTDGYICDSGDEKGDCVYYYCYEMLML